MTDQPEDVAPGVDLVGGWIFGLLQELQHPSGCRGGYGAERARIRHPDQMQGDIGVIVAVRPDHPGQINPEDVAIEYQSGVGSEPVVDVTDTASGAERLFLDDIFKVEAEPPPSPK